MSIKPNPYDAPAGPTASGAASFDKRWIAAISLVAVITLFATLPLILTLLTLLVGNVVAILALVFARQNFAANLAFLTAVLLLASLIFTDWGFSRLSPRVTVSWVCLIPAVISQLALITCPFWRPSTRRAGD